jgi:two-component system, NarL family, response regulator NreC
MSHSVLETQRNGASVASLPARAPIRVLVVDEHALVRAGVRWMLEDAVGIEIVAEACNGQEAVDLVERDRPDVVVIGVEMNSDGGVMTTYALTAVQPHPAVLALIARSDDERIIEVLRAGASGYLTKNVERRELIDALQTAVQGGIHVEPHVSRLLASSLRRPATPTEPDRARAKFQALSERERAVLALVAEGYTGPQIGSRLGITAKTVDTYRHRIREKLGLARRTEYLHLALSLGLLHD